MLLLLGCPIDQEARGSQLPWPLVNPVGSCFRRAIINVDRWIGRWLVVLLPMVASSTWDQSETRFLAAAAAASFLSLYSPLNTCHTGPARVIMIIYLAIGWSGWQSNKLDIVSDAFDRLAWRILAPPYPLSAPRAGCSYCKLKDQPNGAQATSDGVQLININVKLPPTSLSASSDSLDPTRTWWRRRRRVAHSNSWSSCLVERANHWISSSSSSFSYARRPASQALRWPTSRPDGHTEPASLST